MIFEFILFFITGILILNYLQRRERAKLPPGVFGWPIFGKIPTRERPIHDDVEKYKKKYGSVFTWKMGSINFIFLCDYKSIKTAFNNPDLQDRPSFFTLRTITFNRNIGLINGIGKQWQNTRRFTLRHLRNMGMGKTTMEDAITSEIEGIIADFKKHTDGPTEIPISINAAVMNVLWRLVAGKTFAIDSEETIRFQKALTDVFNASQGDLLLFDILPWLVTLSPEAFKNWMGVKKYKKDIATIFELSRSVVEEHKRNLNTTEEPRDVVEAYLQEMEEQRRSGKSDYGELFEEQDLLSALIDMFAAGSDTTSHTIRWILLYMAKYPEIQKKVQDEIDSHIPRDKLPTLIDKEKLPYCDAAFHEVLRHMPQAPLGKYHAAAADTEVLGHPIPKGSIIISSIQSCHLDPKDWPNPMNFQPERFLNADGTFNGKAEGFIPFSIGRRYCLGESLARMEVFLVTSSLLQNFTFSPPEGAPLNLEADPRQPLFNIPTTVKVNIKFRK